MTPFRARNAGPRSSIRVVNEKSVPDPRGAGTRVPGGDRIGAGGQFRESPFCIIRSRSPRAETSTVSPPA